ncbi:MAG: hypothetical protein FJ218_01960 [Ignavibacteria bacterium]|nr:hypothetical protein [Ignavibacteria bacterium]
MKMSKKNSKSRIALDFFIFLSRSRKDNKEFIFRTLRLCVMMLLFVSEQILSQTYFIPYQQNFDSVTPPVLPNNWTTTTNRRPNGDFKTIASAPRSSPNAVIDSNSIIAQSLFSPQLNFTGKIGDSLLFFERRNTTHHSGIIVDAIVNNDTTSPITISDTLRNVVANSYIRRAFSLPNVLNNQSQVQFRWRVLGDSGTSAGFVRFDDIAITAKTQFDASVTNIAFLPMFPIVGDSIRVIATIKNVGLFSFQNDTVKFYFDANKDSSAQQNELFDTKIISSIITPNDSAFAEGIFPNAQFGNQRFIVQSKLANDDDNSNDEFIAEIEVGVPKYSLVVNEIMYKPLSPEPEWLEIVNASNDSINLKQWKISDKNIATKHTITTKDFWLKKDSFVVVVKDSESFFEIHPFVLSKVFVVSSFPSLNNDSDDVVLFDNRNAVMDSVHYKSSWGGSYKSLERIFADSSSLSQSNFGSCIDTARSTPGKINSLTPKEFDIALARMFISPINPLPNSTVSLNTVVKNIGLNTLTSFTIRFYRDANRDSISQINEEIFSDVISQTLNYLDSITFSKMYDSITTGEKYFIVKAEINNDGNLQNNIAYANVTTSILPQSVVVNEIMYAPNGDEPEWVELYNNTGDSLDLKTWKISDNNIETKVPITSLTTILPPDSFVVLTKDTVAFNSIHSTIPSLLLQVSQLPSFNNTGDEVVVYDASGSTIDSVQYKPSWGGNIEGKSLERIFFDSLSNDSTNWGSCEIASTPGERNFITPLDNDVKVKGIFSSRNESQITISAIVENIGLNVVNNFDVKFFDDGNNDSLAQSNELIGTKSISNTNLNYKDSIEVSFDWNTRFSGRRNIICICDITNDERRSNDTLISSVAFPYAENSIVVNEIMYEPLSHKAEYVELYNRSNDTLDIMNWNISSARDTNSSPTQFKLSNTTLNILPKHYFVLVSDSSFITQFPNFDTALAKLLIVNKSSLNLNNDEDDVVLLDLTNTAIDSVHYSYKWHNPELLSTQGHSLERINPNVAANDKRNWSSSTNNGTPGKANSIFTSSKPTATSLSFSPNPFSPDGDGFEDFTIVNYNIPTNVASIRIRMFDVKGRMLRQLSHNEPSGATGEIIWDGKDDDGKTVRIGTYIVFLEALDSFGGNVYSTKAVVVVAAKM